MKNSARFGFTLVELLIGVVMMSIVIAGIAFTVSSGFDLYTTADSNAVVVSGVRFTADSFNRNVAPMLNVTDKIEILSTDLSSIPDHASISDDIHYIFLSNDSVVHRDSKGNHVLEGSGYIDHIEFTIPVPTANNQNNYILKMDIKGRNTDHPNAKLDLVVESSLYNKPTKTGTATGPTGSKVYKGNILKIKASLKLDRLDLYDNDTKIKINKLSVHKGTDIEAVYDLINQLGTSEPMSDDSTIEWFISGSASADITVISEDITLSDIDGIMKNNYWQLFSGANPVKGRVLDTTGTFNVKTETGVTAWPLNDATKIGAIRCRVTPAVKPQSGGSTVTGIPKWSDYVVVKSVTAPSEEFENILGVLGKSKPTGTGDVFFTNYGSTNSSNNTFNVTSGQIQINTTQPSNSEYGAAFVIQLKYDKFDNDRVYGAWAAGRGSSADIPSYITVANYSVVIDSKLNNNDTATSLFLSTRARNTNFGVSNNTFNDDGYAAQYSPYHNTKGFYVSKYINGTEDYENAQKSKPLGVYNVATTNESNRQANYNFYDPALIKTNSFTFVPLQRYRTMYTVLEYYDSIQGKASPRYIFRVRFLKRTDNWDADSNHTAPADKLAEIKKKDPWCIGPNFYLSEPMWFGDFVGIVASSDKTVKVKNYDGSSQTVTVTEDTSNKTYYALKNSSKSAVLRNANLPNISGLLTDGSRYVGVRVIAKNSSNPTNAMTVYGLNFVPGFTINEIRSIMPNNGKLYSIEESIPLSELSTIEAKDWYKSYKNIIASSDINEKIFGATNKKSDGSGDNGSWYYQNAGSDGGIYDLQHIKSGCKCPLHNELFKWFGGQ